MNKTSLVQKVFLGTLICFAVSYCFAVIGKLNHTDSVYPFSVLKRYSDQGQNFIEVRNKVMLPAATVQEIEVFTKAAEIHIESTEKDAIELRLEGKFLPLKDNGDQVLKYETSGNKLIVRTDEGKQSDGLQFENLAARGALTVRIPKSIQRVRLHSVAGHVSGEDFKIDHLQIDTISSEVNFDDIQVADLSYKTVSGECTFSGELQKVEGHSVSGDLELNLKTKSPDINLESVSGDVEVLYSSAPNTGIEFHTTSGSIRLEKAVGLETESSGSFSRVLGSGKGMLQIKTVSASAHVDLDQASP